jgi:hypothetical protein
MLKIKNALLRSIGLRKKEANSIYRPWAHYHNV